MLNKSASIVNVSETSAKTEWRQFTVIFSSSMLPINVSMPNVVIARYFDHGSSIYVLLWLGKPLMTCKERTHGYVTSPHRLCCNGKKTICV